MRDAKEIAETIKKEAEKRGIAIKQLLADCGLKGPVINNMIAGSMPSADKLLLIAHRLDVTLDYLLTGKEFERVYAPTGPELVIPPGLEGLRHTFFDGKDITQEEFDKIAEFVDFVLSKRD